MKLRAAWRLRRPARGRARRAGRRPPEPRFEFPLTIKAGPRLVGVAFVQRTEARDEATLRPRTRSRGTQPAIASVTISGPYNATAPGDSPSRRRIFVCRPAAPADEVPVRHADPVDAGAARLPPAGDRRGPAGPDAVLHSRAAPRAASTSGIQKALERMLVSSQFLFRIERQPGDRRRSADVLPRRCDLELASRLSFFLWSSIPDDELLRRGRSRAGSTDPAVLERQVRRMLADPRSSALVTNFAAQWLYLRDIEAKRPDEVLFQDFDETLRAALQRETELFVDSVFRENRSVIDLLTANYTFLNERLAKHYGVPNVRGSYFRRVTLPEGSPRGGLLGQGSVLTHHVVRHAHLAGAARQVGAREPAVGGAAAAAAQHSRRSKPRAPRRRDADDARGDDAASRQPGVRQLSRAHGSDWLCDGELRRGGPMARPRRRPGDRRDRRRSRTARSSTAWPG